MTIVTKTFDDDLWCLVPREITPEMQRAYFSVIDQNADRAATSAYFGRHSNNKLAWKAALAASPKMEE